MLTNLLFLITGLFGVFSTAMIFLKYNSYLSVNKYIAVIFALSSCRFLFRAIAFFIIDYPLKNYIFLFDLAFIINMPCIYLYFRDLAIAKKPSREDFYHVIPPILIFGLFLILMLGKGEELGNLSLVIGLTILFSFILYASLCFNMLNKNVWKRKSDLLIVNEQNILIRNWSKFLFFGLLLLLVRVIGVFLMHRYSYSFNSSGSFLWVSAVLWLGIFITTIIRPEILYGYDLFNRKITALKSQHVALDNLWNVKATPVITNQKDLKIRDKINENLEQYIRQIENLSFFTPVFRIASLTQDDLAKKLNIPSIHLVYVFKYHANISFSDYKKIVRIQDAIRILETDFLKTNTIHSLATEVGFASYMPFFTSFKNITGVAPQEYYEKITSR